MPGYLSPPADANDRDGAAKYGPWQEADQEKAIPKSGVYSLAPAKCRKTMAVSGFRPG